MRKRIIAITLVLMFVLSMSAYAVEPRINTYTPSLTFNGTTANCRIVVTEYGKEIDVTLTLYRGLSRIDSWSGSGISSVVVSGECAVKTGLEYRLVATGTIDGVAFTSSEVYGTP